jgi:hypothetical protein
VNGIAVPSFSCSMTGGTWWCENTSATAVTIATWTVAVSVEQSDADVPAVVNWSLEFEPGAP